MSDADAGLDARVIDCSIRDSTCGVVVDWFCLLQCDMVHFTEQYFHTQIRGHYEKNPIDFGAMGRNY